MRENIYGEEQRDRERMVFNYFFLLLFFLLFWGWRGEARDGGDDGMSKR